MCETLGATCDPLDFICATCITLGVACASSADDEFTILFSFQPDITPIFTTSKGNMVFLEGPIRINICQQKRFKIENAIHLFESLSGETKPCYGGSALKKEYQSNAPCTVPVLEIGFEIFQYSKGKLRVVCR